jgi:hypothetical protein
LEEKKEQEKEKRLKDRPRILAKIVACEMNLNKEK